MFESIKKVFSNEIKRVDNPEKSMVSFQVEEETDGKKNLSMLKEFAQHNKMPIFKGEVINGYESDFLGYKDRCPLCDTPTEQQMSNFIWTNQVASRLMTAPAGHFCPNCPTVIINDDIIQSAVDKTRFEYWGVCGLETGYEKEGKSSIFKTFNGEKAIYILDEDGTLCGVSNSVHQPEGGVYTFPDVLSKANPSKSIQAKKKKEKNKSQNKQARKARKMNRR